jgi:hypothetical protein
MELARSFPTGVTILRVVGIARWLAWGWMVAVVAFSGDALRSPPSPDCRSAPAS